MHHFPVNLLYRHLVNSPCAWLFSKDTNLKWCLLWISYFPMEPLANTKGCFFQFAQSSSRTTHPSTETADFYSHRILMAASNAFIWCGELFRMKSSIVLACRFMSVKSWNAQFFPLFKLISSWEKLLHKYSIYDTFRVVFTDASVDHVNPFLALTNGFRITFVCKNSALYNNITPFMQSDFYHANMGCLHSLVHVHAKTKGKANRQQTV